MQDKSRRAAAALLLALLVAGLSHLADTGPSRVPAPHRVARAEGEPALPVLRARAARVEVAVADRAVDDPAEARAAAADEEARTWLRGRVVDARGAPLGGAEVLVLPPGVTVLDEQQAADPRFVRARSAADGTFALEGPAVPGRLLAFVEGHPPAHLPLPEATSADEVVLRVPDPRTIVVRVSDPLGRWPAGCGLSLVADPARTFARALDAHRLAHVQRVEGSDEHGPPERTFPIPTLAPLRVAVTPPRGWAAVPGEVLLEAEEESASFDLVPSGIVRLCVVDDETGAAPVGERSVGLFVSEVETGRVAESTGGRHVDPTLNRRLSPGRYRLDVAVDGYVPAHRDFQVRHPGDDLDLVVRLQRRRGAQEMGAVLLRVASEEPATGALRALAAEPTASPHADPFAVFVRREGEQRWRDAYPLLLADGRLELRPMLIETRDAGLPAGTYDLYVARRGTGTAAFVPSLLVFADPANEVDVHLRPGCLIRVTDVFETGSRGVRALAVASAETGPLPLLHFTRDGAWTIVSEADVEELLREPLAPRALGPFPARRVTVTLERAQGDAEVLQVGDAAGRR